MITEAYAEDVLALATALALDPRTHSAYEQVRYTTTPYGDWRSVRVGLEVYGNDARQTVSAEQYLQLVLDAATVVARLLDSSDGQFVEPGYDDVRAYLADPDFDITLDGLEFGSFKKWISLNPKSRLGRANLLLVSALVSVGVAVSVPAMEGHLTELALDGTSQVLTLVAPVIEYVGAVDGQRRQLRSLDGRFSGRVVISVGPDDFHSTALELRGLKSDRDEYVRRLRFMVTRTVPTSTVRSTGLDGDTTQVIVRTRGAIDLSAPGLIELPVVVITTS